MSTAYRDADGSEFFVLPSGEAVRADGTRVPELDGPPAGACPECGAYRMPPDALDRGEVARVLAEHYGRYRAAQRNPFHPSLANAAGYYADEVADLANDLGLGEDLDAAVKAHQAALAQERAE